MVITVIFYYMMFVFLRWNVIIVDVHGIYLFNLESETQNSNTHVLQMTIICKEKKFKQFFDTIRFVAANLAFSNDLTIN